MVACLDDGVHGGQGAGGAEVKESTRHLWELVKWDQSSLNIVLCTQFYTVFCNGVEESGSVRCYVSIFHS